MKKFLSLAMLVWLVLAISCESPDTTPTSTPTSTPDEVLEYIKSLGFTDDQIVDQGDRYVVDSDMVFAKNMNIQDLDRNATGGRTKQRFTGTVSLSGQSNIRVFVDPSMTNWLAEVTSAIDHWNQVLNTNIRFTIVPGAPYDILIRNADLPGNTCGQAWTPSGGNAGHTVEIDQAFLTVVVGNNFAQRRRTIIHEFGHTIGFLHTNEASGTLVPGTPTTDAASLMNGGECGIGATVLSAFDVFTTVAKYPVPAEELYIVRSGTLFAVDYNTGIGIDLNTGWDQTVAMASTGSFIYAVTAGSLYQINPNNNSVAYFSDYPDGWAGTEGMAATGGNLYAIQGGTLWRVTISNGDVGPFSDYPDGWSGTEAMVAYGSYLYAIQGGTLWRVNLSNGGVGNFSDYPDGWSGTEAMTAYGSYLYAVQGGTLWRVNLSNGDVGNFSDYPDNWAGTETLTAKDGYLFATQGGAIWRVTISNGDVIQLGTDNWTGTEAMSARL